MCVGECVLECMHVRLSVFVVVGAGEFVCVCVSVCACVCVCVIRACTTMCVRMTCGQ